MNILFVHEVDWLKKVVFDIHNMAESLNALGHHVYAVDYENNWSVADLFVSQSYYTMEFARISRTLPDGSVTLIRPGFVRLPGLSRLTAAYSHLKVIGRVIMDKKIDVVVLYGIPTNGMQTISQARRAGIPVVFRSIDILHELVANPVFKFFTEKLERKVYARVDRILGITPNHTRYVTEMGASGANVKLLLYPIDTNVFYPDEPSSELREKWGIGRDEKIILFIGTLFEFSGLDRFINRFPAILDQHPDARLLIVGDGPQKQRLESLIKNLKLAHKVIITGFEPYLSTPLYINLATVCINPFLDTETTHGIFPGNVVQCIACGKPTVATPLEGITAIIPDESRGVIYADTPEAIAAEASILLSDPGRCATVGKAGLTYVSLFHDQYHIAKQMEQELFDVTGIKTGSIPAVWTLSRPTE
ncbi:glycosyltransferase family 4 protein [Chloroflexota bacterium]